MVENQDIGYLIKFIHDAIGKKINNQLKDFNLTSSQIQVLMYLHEQEGEVTQKDIEIHLGVTHPTVVGILKRLESKGFIATATDCDDRRMKNVYLLGESKKLYNTMSETKEMIDNSLLKGLNQSQIQELQQFLKQLYNNIK